MPPQNVKEVRRRLSILLNNDNLVDNYIRRFGPKIDMKCVKAIKESTANEATGEVSEDKGKDPVFEINLICPVCNAEVTGYELRAKTQQIIMTKFNVPIYSGAMGFRSINFNHLSVSVCTRCFFASPDKKDFSSISKTTKLDIPSQIPTNPISLMQEKIGERKAIVSTITNQKNYFSRPRNIDAAIISYKLAIARARVEAFFDMPYSYYKLGSYQLKIARLLKDSEESDAESLEEALNYFITSFSKSDVKSEDVEYQVIYSIVALYLRLGNQNKSNSYISALDKIKTKLKTEAKQDPGINITTVMKWVEKSKRLWEDRDMEDLFADS